MEAARLLEACSAALSGAGVPCPLRTAGNVCEGLAGLSAAASVREDGPVEAAEAVSDEAVISAPKPWCRATRDRGKRSEAQ